MAWTSGNGVFRVLHGIPRYAFRNIQAILCSISIRLLAPWSSLSSSSYVSFRIFFIMNGSCLHQLLHPKVETIGYQRRQYFGSFLGCAFQNIQAPVCSISIRLLAPWSSLSSSSSSLPLNRYGIFFQELVGATLSEFKICPYT